MELFLQFIALSAVIAFTAAVYFRILPVREKVSCNSIMIAAMALGTMNGLIMGTMLALTQSFSVNCILSLIVGMSTGVILGATFNSMTAIEGMLGGVMGGLMGAMLGEMLIVEFIYLLSLVLMLVSGLVVVLLIKHIGEETGTQKARNNLKKPSFGKLTLIVAGTSLLLFLGIAVGTNVPSEHNENLEETHQH
ncbi:hypothetical protein SAMN04487975_10522 [Planococcus glaciei]|uniref:hypothetical protein n=1 Tax=Planococcus glaciei TaxID=459472 RepID=UPI00088552CE|nr:hypothetical protein [Planococcus glaciei]SDH47249.1 hypothetical protein SAMN04487975_10522 [Planococcus glaciei]